MKSTLIFNDISSNDLGLVIQAPPTYEFPERDMSSTHIPGRNGDLVIDNNCYKNVTRSYSLAKGYTTVKHHVPNATAILEWLTSANGDYVRLEDSYDPTVYRMARFYSSGSFTDYYDQALAISVSFECKPQRFLKEGDTATKTAGAIAHAVNPSHYDSLPLIRVDGIPNSISNVMMLSVLNSDDDVVANISMTDIEHQTVCIDSDAQNCYDDEGNINEKIGLNGNDFPTFGTGTNTIKVEKFEKENQTIESYNYLISCAQTIVKSEYKSYSDIETIRQSKATIKSYSSLIDSKKKTYSASSYQSYISSVCTSGHDDPLAAAFTFSSFNTILSNYGQQYSISGDVTVLSLPEWLTATQDGTNITLKAGKAGFFITSNDKVVTYFAAGATVSTTTSNKTTTITYYEANENRELAFTYPEIPSWIKVTIGYKDSGSTRTLSSVTYSTNAIGYFWTDKTWTFGKAQWNYRSETTDLNTLTWNTSKKAFMSTTGISTSTTTSYTYKYFASVIQYEDTDETPLLFTTEIVNSDISVIRIKAKEDGWYSVSVGGATANQWVKYSAGTQIQTGTTISGTSAFEVYYIPEPPTYSEEEDWPEWLNPTPSGDKSDLLNSSTISFAVNETSKYRWSYKDGDNEKYTDWADYSADTKLNVSKPVSEQFYICKIDSIPSEYDYDRCYDDSPEIPSFLAVNFYSDSDMTKEITPIEYRDLEDKSTVMIKFTTKVSGYYKWGSNSAWLYEEAGTVMFSTGYKDSATFYFMSTLPSYEIYDLFTVTPHADTTGNPDEVTFTVKKAGYYRVNSNSDWTWFAIGETLATTVVGKQTTINHLKNLNADLSNLSITITPRWWML